jgi:hypothetical protein
MADPKPGPKLTPQSTTNLLIIHMPYHPQHPPKNDLRDLTTNLENALTLKGCEIEQIIWAISKASNIGELNNRIPVMVPLTAPLFGVFF